MQLKINEEVLSSLLKLRKKILSRFSDHLENVSNSGLKFINELYPELNGNISSLKTQAVNYKTKIPIEFFRISATKIFVSFIKAQKTLILKDSERTFGALGIINSLSGELSSIMESPLVFKELIIADSFQSLIKLRSSILHSIKNQLIHQFYMVLGTPHPMHNKIGIVENLGLTVLEYNAEPAKGIIKGPSSIKRKTIKEIKGMLEINRLENLKKIRNTGLKQKILKKSKPNSEVIYKNLQEITDIFVKPNEPPNKLRYIGFFNTNPPLCSADALRNHNFLNNNSNKETLLNKGKVSSNGRKRFPRHFGAKLRLEPYNHELAQAQELLRSLEIHKKEYMVYYLHLIEEEDMILILTTKNFLLIVYGELVAKVKVAEIDMLEVHRFHNQFQLCIGTCKREHVLKS